MDTKLKLSLKLKLDRRSYDLLRVNGGLLSVPISKNFGAKTILSWWHSSCEYIKICYYLHYYI